MQTETMPIAEFARRLTDSAVSYREEPFQLRGGGHSHWYVDHRVGLSLNEMIYTAGNLLVGRLELERVEFDISAGGGVGGVGLAIHVGRASRRPMAMANLNKDDKDPQDGYGLYGADVEGKRVVLVDDIGSTGSSLIELNELVISKGGITEHAITVSDRSKGRVATALAEIGLTYRTLLEFNEETGKLSPVL